jgi:hypothetical protein
MAFPDVHHRESRSSVLRVLVPSCEAVGALGVLIVGLVTTGISGWGMALSAVPGIAAVTAVGVWSVRQRRGRRTDPRPPVLRAARKESAVRVTFLFGQSFDRVLVVDGLAETAPLHPLSPRTPFSLVVRRPRPGMADRLIVSFVAECCESGEDLELVFRGCSRRVLLRRGEMEVTVDLAEPARFRVA